LSSSLFADCQCSHLDARCAHFSGCFLSACRMTDSALDYMEVLGSHFQEVDLTDEHNSYSFNTWDRCVFSACRFAALFFEAPSVRIENCQFLESSFPRCQVNLEANNLVAQPAPWIPQPDAGKPLADVQEVTAGGPRPRADKEHPTVRGQRDGQHVPQPENASTRTSSRRFGLVEVAAAPKVETNDPSSGQKR